MELVEGGSLDDLLMQTPRLPINNVLNIALDLADALTRAHRLNIIHRDIKPANVLLAKDGMLRLTDFGIARVVGSDITETGSLLGTIAYIAPEIFQGKHADARSDIWSMGLMLFEMLAGEHPFLTEKGVADLIKSILTEPLPDLEVAAPGCPDRIDRRDQPHGAERPRRTHSANAAGRRGTGSDSRQRNGGHHVRNPLKPAYVKFEGGSRFETPPAAAVELLRHNLPAQTTPFVGREAELG